MRELPHNTGSLLDWRKPRMRLDDLVLAERVRAALADVLREHEHAGLLACNGLKPAVRLLFNGPPGVGKTASSEALAAELAVPFAVVRQDEVLGDSSKMLRQVFNAASQRAAVVLLDEFDAFGGRRIANAKDSGGREMNAIVNMLLQLLEQHRGPSVVIAATNLADSLDDALDRRFDVRVEFPLPTEDERRELVRRQLGEVDGFLPEGSHAVVVRECLRERKRRVMARAQG